MEAPIPTAPLFRPRVHAQLIIDDLPPIIEIEIITSMFINDFIHDSLTNGG